MNEPSTVTSPKTTQHPNAAAKRLASRGSLREIATPLGVTHTAVSGWLKGAVPHEGMRAKIREVWGVPEADWFRTADAVDEPEPPELDVMPADAAGLEGLIVQVQKARSQPGLSPATLAQLGAVEVRAVAARERLRSGRAKAALSSEGERTFEMIFGAAFQHPLVILPMVRRYIESTGDSKRLADHDRDLALWRAKHAALLAEAERIDAELLKALPPGMSLAGALKLP